MQKLCQGKLCHPFCTSKHVPKFSNVLLREKQSVDSKNLISFTPDSCQGNNADFNPSDLEEKQNSSRTRDWLHIFLHVFKIYKTGSYTTYAQEQHSARSVRVKKEKQITRFTDLKYSANISQAQNALLG